MNQLAVLDRGTLRVHDPVSGRSTTLSTADAANRQPTWAPGGRRLAWSRYDRRNADARSRVVVVDLDRNGRVTERVELDLVFPAFYLHWRPDAAAIATLGEGPLGIELSVLDVASGTGSIVSRGAPLFFDWASSGRLVAHVGLGPDRRLEQHGAPSCAAMPSPAGFTAPARRAESDEVLAAIRRDGTALLVLLDAAGEAVRRLAAFGGTARFAPSPDGRRVAWMSGPDEEVPAPGFAPDVRRAVPGELVVHDLETDCVDVVAHTAPLAFEWSPDGRSLLYLATVDVGSARWFRWHVWRHGETIPMDWCRPSVVEAREYLPFADQFARSHRRWSRDGTCFAYAGTAPDGREGVWVQQLDGGGPELACPGQAAVFAP